jgi:hypothetical protein
MIYKIFQIKVNKVGETCGIKFLRVISVCLSALTAVIQAVNSMLELLASHMEHLLITLNAPSAAVER